MPSVQNSGTYPTAPADYTLTVQEVESAVPAFIGYTAKATRKGPNDLHLKPLRVCSLREYESFYGVSFHNRIGISVEEDEDGSLVIRETSEEELHYTLYHSVKSYFDNGGGPCYIVSVDTYHDNQFVTLRYPGSQLHAGLLDGLEVLSSVRDASLLLIPEAVRLNTEDYACLVQEALQHCYLAGNRFALFDLRGGHNRTIDLVFEKSLFGRNHLQMGTACYPFLRTKTNSFDEYGGESVLINFGGNSFDLAYARKYNQQLYRLVRKELRNRFVEIPPSGAVAGALYTTDRKRGVWKSPANLVLQGIRGPVENQFVREHISQNADPEPARPFTRIRAFAGKGVMLSGIRTLSERDYEGRFVPLSRFALMVRESVLRSTRWVKHEPNNATTWYKIEKMICQYLMDKWQDGALAGANPRSGFYVRCGLGKTMTMKEILEGRTVIEIGISLLQPSEFTVIRIVHQAVESRVSVISA